MKDIAQKELLVNDIVAFNPPYYKGLLKGTILGFTPQKVRIEYKWQNRLQKTTMFPQDVAKLEGL